jgi:hypothetical protein
MVLYDKEFLKQIFIVRNYSMIVYNYISQYKITATFQWNVILNKEETIKIENCNKM